MEKGNGTTQQTHATDLQERLSLGLFWLPKANFAEGAGWYNPASGLFAGRPAYITHNERYISGIDPTICLLIGASDRS